MLHIKEKIQEELLSVLNGMGIRREIVSVDQSNSLENGDLTTNIAMQISKELGRSPREVADEIVSKLNVGEYISKVEVAGPGFINFFISEKEMLKNISDILQNGQKAFEIGRASCRERV